MIIKHPFKKLTLFCILFTSLNLFSQTVVAQSNESYDSNNAILDAISAGKIDLGLRLRYEHVNDAAVTEEADALTNRTTLGYKTGNFNNFSARILAQDVREIVNEFNDGTGTSANRTRYAVVADPADTDLLEAYVAYGGIKDSSIKLGRQIITYRNAPFHRFVGTVLWRQNWQNHDAVTIENKSLADTTIRYAYTWNVNRIFTDKAIIPGRAEFDSDSHFFNIQYSGFKYSTLEAYSYLLDFNNALASSTATYGVKYNGVYPVSDKIKILFAAEYANQNDYANNPVNVNEDYFLAELGANFTVDNVIETLTLKVDYEKLSGNGISSFNTPLATGHAYQGWTDRFLTTPADGVEDLYFTAIAKLFTINFLVVYHDLSSENDSYDFGTEINIQATRPISNNFTIGLKYADYNADNNALNVSRNANIARDVSKIWSWFQFTY